MKKFSTVILGVSVLCAISCNQKELNETSCGVFYVKAVANADAEAGRSKVVYEDGEGIQWLSSEDAGLSLVNEDASSILTSSDISVSEDGYTGTFTFSGVSSGSYRPYHGLTAAYSSPSREYYAEVGASQTQTEGGVMNSGIIPMIGREDISYDGTEAVSSAKFYVVGTIVRFLIYGGAEGETVTSVKMQIAESDITDSNYPAGQIITDDSGDVRTYLESPTAAANGSVTVTLGTGVAANGASKDDATGIYAHIIPCTGTFVYTVTTDKGVYEFASASSKAYVNNKIYNLPLNIAKGTEPDATAPEIKSFSAYDISYASGNSEDVTVTAADNVNLASITCRLYSSDWETVIDEEVFSVSGTGNSCTYTLDYDKEGSYLFVAFATDAAGNVSDWWNTGVTVTASSSDDTAPAITLTSATSAVVGETYTLQVTFADPSGITTCWPKIYVSDGTWTKYPALVGSLPTGYWANSGNANWGTTVSGTEFVFTLPISFSSADTYHVYIYGSVADTAGNATAEEQRQIGTITVSEK